MPPLMRSELPILATARHHWVVLFRLPPRVAGLALLALFVWGLFQPAMLIVLLVVLTAALILRERTWNAERIILTRKRIIRVQGVPETTSSEASLRIDRVSGARLIQTVPGKMFGYGTIELEAPGDHPDVRKLVRIARPNAFYAELRALVFGEPHPPDPDEDLRGRHSTTPIPRLGPPSAAG